MCVCVYVDVVYATRVSVTLCLTALVFLFVSNIMYRSHKIALEKCFHWIPQRCNAASSNKQTMNVCCSDRVNKLQIPKLKIKRYSIGHSSH